MIDLSDEEDEVEEIKPEEKIQKTEGAVSSPKAKEKSSLDDAGDVLVVGEVSAFRKYPRGAVLGPARSHEPFGLHIGNVKRRKRTENNSMIKYGTIRRNISSSSFRNACSSSMMRRKLFYVGEAVRLEEKKKYMQLIQAIIGYEMIAASYILKSFLHFFAPQVCRTFQNLEPHRLPQPVQSPVTPTRCAIRTRPPTIVCVDLDSDSDNDVVEVPQGSQASEDSDQLTRGDRIVEKSEQVIDLEQESEDPSLLLQTSYEHPSLEIEHEACASSAESKQTDADDTYINLVDDDEVEEEGDSDCVAAEPCSTENKPKGNLADKMIQQMIINDEGHISAESDKHNEEEEEASEDDLEESLPEITYSMQMLVHKAFNQSRPRDVLAEAFNLTVNGRDILTLKGNNWLNDQVINFYMCLLVERGKLGSYPSVYCFNTFFFVKLVSSGHPSLKRWTRTIDVFSYDMLIIPIHMRVHWCLAAVNFIEKKIEYYDSMRDNNNNNNYGQALLKYLQDEHLDKKNKEFNTTGWEIVNLKDIPEQLNGCDCGVFACTYAEYICRLAKLTFTQQHMPYFRVKMAYEVLTKKLLL